MTKGIYQTLPKVSEVPDLTKEQLLEVLLSKYYDYALQRICRRNKIPNTNAPSMYFYCINPISSPLPKETKDELFKEAINQAGHAKEGWTLRSFSPIPNTMDSWYCKLYKQFRTVRIAELAIR